MFETLLLATSIICGVGVNVSNNQVSEPTQVVSKQVESSSISRTSGPKLKNRSTSDNIFDVEYVFDSNIDAFSIISDDIVLKEDSIVDNVLNLKLQANATLSKMELNTILVDGSIVKEPLYVCLDKANIFISDLSEDDAWYQATKYGAEELAIYDEEDITKNYDLFSQRSLEQNTSVTYNTSTFSTNSNNKATYVEGHLTWTTKDGSIHPLKNIRVDLYDEDLWILGEYIQTTYTDDYGYYRFTFSNPDEWYCFENGGYDPFIRFYPDSKTFEIARDWLFNNWIFSFYYFCSDTVKNVKTGSTTNISLRVTYNEDNMANRAISIAEAMVEAQDFAHDYVGMPLNKLHLNVLYPWGDTSFSGKLIFEGYCGIQGSKWQDWHTIMHEYGHYIENVMGTYGADIFEIICNDPHHYIYKDHLNDKKDKEYAMELAWSEAWSSAFAMITYDCLDLSNIEFAKNSIENEITYFESYIPDQIESGEGQERALIAYLWDLYDSNNESDDSVSLGAKNFLKATLQNGMYTLTDFINYFEENYSEIISQNGQLLENNQIAPNLLPFYEKVESTRPLTIEFYPNGSSYNPNDEFDLEFLSPNGESLATSYDLNVNVTSNKEKVIYTIPYSIWELIYEKINPYPFVYVTLAGYHSKSPKSGPYHSAYKTLVVHDYAYITPEMYGFPEGYCSTAETKLVEADGADFYTTRLRTGFIEDEYINLCPRKEGYGTSYLEYGFFESISKIDINLSFWSDDERYYAADDPEAQIEYWDEDSNTWVECLDLLEANLPTDRNNQKTYTIEFEEPVLSFRIYTHFSNMTGYTDRNKGRISIGDMIVYFD